MASNAAIATRRQPMSRERQGRLRLHSRRQIHLSSPCSPLIGCLKYASISYRVSRRALSIREDLCAQCRPGGQALYSHRFGLVRLQHAYSPRHFAPRRLSKTACAACVLLSMHFSTSPARLLNVLASFKSSWIRPRVPPSKQDKRLKHHRFEGEVGVYTLVIIIIV